MTAMNHVMIDIETLGTEPGSVITSIGAVRFDPHTSNLGSSFYRELRIESCRGLGLDVNMEALRWWAKQDQELLLKQLNGKGTARNCLEELAYFIYKSVIKTTFVWSHGVGFDIVLLEHAYRLLNITLPWSYSNLRDTRTIFDLAKLDYKHFSSLREGRKEHDALDDAITQAIAVSECYHLLGK